MSNVGSTLLECPDVQGELDSAYVTCGHATKHRESPFLQFLMSPQNKSGIQSVLVPGRGKIKTVVWRYDQKISVASINEVDDCDLVCTTDNRVGDLSKTDEIDPCLKQRYTEGISAIELARICRDNPTFIMDRINIAAAALEAAVATKIAEEAIALIGAWASDVAGVTGNTLAVATRLSGGNPSPRFTSELNLAAMKTGYCAPQAIFGSSLLWQDTDLLNTGCCAASGIQLFETLQRYGKVTMWDSYIVAAMNADDRNALMTQLGAMQIVFANLGSEASFAPIVGAAATNFEVIPMVTPRYGVPFDLTLSNACGQLSWDLTTSSKLFAAPLDMFPVDDLYEGVNFVNQIQVVNP